MTNDNMYIFSKDVLTKYIYFIENTYLCIPNMT